MTKAEEKRIAKRKYDYDRYACYMTKGWKWRMRHPFMALRGSKIDFLNALNSK